MDSDSDSAVRVKAEVRETSSSDSNSLLDATDGVQRHRIPEVTKLPQTKEAKTSLLFSKSQRKYLESLKSEYKETTDQNLQSELQLTAADYMLDRLAKKGVTKTKGEKAAFRLNVRRWFQQNCRAEKDLPQFEYAWTGRRVYYHLHPEIVKAERKVVCKAAGEVVSDSELEVDPDASEDEDSTLPDDVSKDTPSDNGPKATSEKTSAGRKRPKVQYFQTALSNVYGRLPPTLRKTYKKKAVEWRMTGPNEATKRLLAGKYLPCLGRHFANTVHKQMGVRLAMLVTYVVPDGNTAASFLDYTEEFGGQSFSKDFAVEIEKSSILTHWGAYAKGEFNDSDEKEKPEDGQIRKRGKPLLNLELNKYGEPVIPDPMVVPAGEQPNQYLGRLIRNIVIYNYARSCGREPKDVGPPWTRMAEDVWDFINSEYLPDDLVPFWKDPTNISVKAARKILQFWYIRQQEHKIPLEIHSYWDGEQLVPCEPRQLLALDDHDPDFEEDIDIIHVPKVPKPSKKRIQKAAKRRESATKVGPAVKEPMECSNKQTTIVPKAVDGGKLDVDGQPPLLLALAHAVDPVELLIQIPTLTPIPRPNTNQPTVLEVKLDALAADPELAMLDKSIRKLALGVIKRHITESNHTSAAPLTEPLTHWDGAATSTLLVPTADVNVIPSTSQLSTALKLSPTEALRPPSSTSLVPPSNTNVGATTSTPIQTTDTTNKRRSVQGRRRKTEEEDLLEMAQAAGALSGPRRSRRQTEKKRNGG